jgi:hypothetical protein
LKQLAYSKLRSLAKNKTENKITGSEKSLDAMIDLMNYKNNFEEHIRSGSNYDAANILLAEDNWMRRRLITTHGTPISEGCVFKTDFGKAYIGECAYIHFSLCIRLYKDKALVIPTTSNEDKFTKAFHPTDNKKGSYALRRGNKSEGFAVNCALYMNDAKFISLGRIIKSFPAIGTDALENIKRHLFSICFPNYDKKLIDTVKENENLKRYNGELEGNNKNLQAELSALKNKLTC